MTIRRRLSLILVGVVAAFVILIGTGTWFLARSSLLGPVDDLLSEQAAALPDVRRLENEFLGGPPRGVEGRFGEESIRLQILDRAGNVELATSPLPVDAAALEEAAAGGDAFQTIELDGRPFRMLTQQDPTGFVQLATEITTIESGLDRLERRIVVIGLVGVVAAGLLGSWLARRFTQPIVDVTAAAGQLATAAELPEPIQVDRSDEVGQLADSFNELVAALRLSRQQQARLVADASHELRTPLTSLRMKIEFLESQPDLPAEQRSEIVAGAAAELESLGALVGELVELAANTAGEEEPEPLDLGGLVEDAARRARLTTHRSVTVSTSGSTVTARPTMVKRALSNLIDNANKYSPPDAPIEIHEFDGGIEVRDHGPGIAPEDRPFAFDRFYRAADTQTKPGSGIGLAIVRQVAEAHGGEVWIDEPAGGGAVVGFSVSPRPPTGR